ncbi:UNVERIFIED_ORG: hypothetical protein ABIB52_004165, partial [Arthrobacter sp. UYCu721]
LQPRPKSDSARRDGKNRTRHPDHHPMKNLG